MAKPVARVRKHKARARLQASSDAQDSNPDVIVPSSKDDHEARRDELRKDLQAQQPASKLSSQKKKRLDKYIDTKLKKEANQDLIKRLAEQNVDTSRLKSSKTLGRGHATRREKLSEALQAERAGFGTQETDEVLYERQQDVAPYSESEASEDDSPSDTGVMKGTIAVKAAPAVLPFKSTVQVNGGFGSGLKRPLELDASGKPVIQQRKRIKPSPKSHNVLPSPDSEEEWAGFSDESEGVDGPDLGIDKEKAALLSQLLNASSSSESEESEEEDELKSEDAGSDDDDNDASEDDDESDEGSEEPDNEQDGPDSSNNDRISNFKAWALSQRNEASGYEPIRAPDLTAMKPTPRPQSTNSGPKQPALPNLNVPDSEKKGRRAFHVSVTRSEEVQETRSKLPVVGKEQEIMETVFTNDCTIVTGATGSGKTTQVPQFLFEAGYGAHGGPTPGMIGITQPRRVAAVSMAQRVAHELGDHAQKVSHQIRFDSTVSANTAIKFMTDGVLLREVSQDFLLTKYSAIIIDEAHERSVNTDILIGMLTRVVETRAKLAKSGSEVKPLKLIIMSATLRIADFTTNESLFRAGPPPVVEAEGKAHPVVTHFARRTHREYVDDAIEKVSKGHRKLPPGGMLVFLTGQNEIVQMGNKLKEKFQPTDECLEQPVKMRISAAEADVEDEDVDFSTLKQGSRDDLDSDEADDEGEANGAHGASRLKAPEDLDFDVEPEEERIIQKVHVLPLYSQLPSHLQMRVFDPPPPNSRLIVLATNVAETSLTIPGIRYVFDTGRSKEKSYEPSTGVQSFDIDWISKASAEQRRGRAGRTGPGHCYRLYSSAIFENHFIQHAAPEIQRVPVEGVVLQLKSMGIPDVSSFPFPTPPDRSALVRAGRLLENLGAVQDGSVTAVGQQLSQYPVSPRLARMLVAAQASNCKAHALALVAVLSSQELLIPESQFDFSASAGPQPTTKAHNEAQRAAYGAFHAHASRLDRQSDALKLLAVFADYTADTTSRQIATYARPKALAEAQHLRRQLARIFANATNSSSSSSANAATAERLSPTPLPAPTPAQVRTLRQLLAVGFIDHVAQRADLSPTPPAITPGSKPRTATHVPYIPLSGAAASSSSADAHASYVFVHASSALARCAPDALPRFVVYSRLSRGAPSTITSANGDAPRTRTRMHPLAPVSSEALVALARGTPLLGEGKPVGRIERMERGKNGEERRRVWSVPFLKGSASAGGAAPVEWPLPPARLVVQRRTMDRGWVEEQESEGSGGR